MSLTKVQGALVHEYSNPNLFINSDFSVNQRGSSSYTASGYTFDRWYLNNVGGSDEITIESNVFDPNWGNVFPLKFGVLSGSSASRNIQQRIENVRRFQNTTVTLSCNINAQSGQEIYYSVRQHDSSGVSIWDSGQMLLGTGDGTIKTITASVDLPDIDETTYDISDDTSSYFVVLIYPQVTHSDPTYMSAPKLEFGSVATPYVVDNAGDNIAKCQRYYQYINGLRMNLWNKSSTRTHTDVLLSTPVRIEDAVLGYGSTVNVSSIEIFEITSEGYMLMVACESSDNDSGTQMYNITIDAEL